MSTHLERGGGPLVLWKHTLLSLMPARFSIGVLIAGLCSLIGLVGTTWAVPEEGLAAQHVVTIYDQGERRVVLTKEHSVGSMLQQAGIQLDKYDKVEPTIDTELVADQYTVNIYRARPVLIIDGMRREQVLSSYGSPRDILREANIAVRDEDEVRLSRADNMLADGVGAKLTIERAKRVSLLLYGVQTDIYTRASTVADLLQEKKIAIGKTDTISVPQDTAVVDGMAIEIWREGAQTVTIEEAVAFSTRYVLDADLPLGYRAIKTPGVPGKQKAVYEIVRQGGREVRRTVVQTLVVQEPTEQVEVIGNKSKNPLTRSKGAHHFVDSKGISHRETYYDLPMNVVIGACGGGGYTVREDGAKVDKDGYILVAAHLGNYPRCSIVETSMGLGKVYDTGGFVAKHPHGFDLATDWTDGDGR